MIVRQADSNTIRTHTHKLDTLTSYPHKPIILDMYGYTGSVLTLSPLPNRNGNDDYVVWINNVIYEDLHTGTDETIDISTTGLNGLVDGITFVAANARDFLIWAFANNANNGFTGFAVTHKPYSTYTGPAAIGLGATLNVTGLTNAYQFTPGARIVIRNTVGTAPQYQWNWGIVNSIVSSTSINVTMDNLPASYGVALTAATGGEIVQWDKFRPWVVTASDQTLYTNNYRLLGELDTNNSGHVQGAYRVDDPYRPLRFYKVYSDTNATITAGTGTAQSLGRYIPIWSKRASIWANGLATIINVVYHVFHRTLNTFGSGIQFRTQVANVYAEAQSDMAIDQYATVYFGVNATTNNNDDFAAWVIGYYVPGGMRE
jgi:hypothetical protein